ncbi:MAG: hypothetical protein J5706_04295 [Elusimicrobiales bacterium]|nr:hypothetical protein [Elusimicrobiales bacterium]
MKQIISFFFSVAFLFSAATANAGALSELAAQAKSGNASSRAVPAASVPAASASKNVGTPAANKNAEWLVMVYIAGMNNLGIYGEAFKNVNQMELGLYEAGDAASSISIAVEYGEISSDGLGNSTIPEYLRTLMILPDGDFGKINSQVINVSRYADTGNVKTLEKFVRRVKPRFPSKKTALIIWNHGGGIVGIASDDVYGSMMKLKNLSATLKSLTDRFGKFDVLATDACLMQMASVAYEFKDYAKVVIGSEQPIPGAGYPYKGMIKMLAMKGSQIDASAFGKILVGGYGEQYRSGSNISLSAIDSSKFSGFVSLLNNWAGLMMSDKASFKVIAKANVLKEVSRMDSLECSRDLIHMIHTINKQDGVSQRIKDAGTALENYITSKLVIANYASETEENFGLAIYLPDLRYEANPYETLKFSADSRWSEFVKKVLQSRLDNGW